MSKGHVPAAVPDASGLQFIVAAKPARTNRAAKRRRSKAEPVELAA